MVCIKGREDRKNGPPQIPTATEIRLIWLGVSRVPASRREICNEIGRSTWRAMNPSVSLTSDRKSRRSAAPTSAAVSTIKGSIAARIRAGGPKREASRASTSRKPRAAPPWSKASAASGTEAAGSITMRFGIVPQPAGSMRAEASRSSQSPSARMAAGARISDAG